MKKRNLNGLAFAIAAIALLTAIGANGYAAENRSEPAGLAVGSGQLISKADPVAGERLKAARKAGNRAPIDEYLRNLTAGKGKTSAIPAPILPVIITSKDEGPGLDFADDILVSDSEEKWEGHPDMVCTASGSFYLLTMDMDGDAGVDVWKSTDEGESWDYLRGISYPTLKDTLNPSIAVPEITEDFMYVAYSRDSYVILWKFNLAELTSEFHTIHTNVTFEPHNPRIVTDDIDYPGGYYLYVAYITETLMKGGDGSEVRVARSLNYGETWVDDFTLDITDFTSFHPTPDIACGDDYVYVTWDMEVPPDDELDVYTCRSADYGYTWEVPVNITADVTYHCSGPRIEQIHNSGEVMVAYTKDYVSDTDVWYGYSTDSGVTWDTNRCLACFADENEQDPDIAVGLDLGDFHAVYWNDYEIIYTSAPYTNPLSWTGAVKANDTMDASRWFAPPAVAVHPVSGAAGVAWSDFRLPTYGLFFDRFDRSSFLAELEWRWDSPLVEPDYNQVMMAPAAADLDGDGIPEIIFSTFYDDWHVNSILRAIHGSDGGAYFSVTDAAYRLDGGAEVAVADIDNDGRPEILAVTDDHHLICFEHDGAHKWTSTEVISRLAPAVADLDGDAVPEIIAGKRVFNSDGTLRWTGSGSNSYNAVAADLDLDGVPEVVAGTSAYRSDGTLFWTVAGSTWSRAGIGDFDMDYYPEVALTGAGEVTLWEHDGTAAWGPVDIPGDGGSGPPLVADFDGDGIPEIGVAGNDYYMVLESDGGIKWTAVIKDYSSGAASASAFDFDGDGSFEILYRDEEHFRIFNGSDGFVLFETPSSSGTLMEHPIVVDVDDDGAAEIVVPTNNYAFSGETGIEVYGNDVVWPAARKIWNQHSYHITNIYDDATVPTFETSNWDLYNNFKAQADVSLIGDLVVSLTPPLPATVPQGGILEYDVRVTNNTGGMVGFDYWTDVILPNGTTYPPAGALFGPVPVTLGGYSFGSAALSHNIPLTAPLGTYTYRAYVGGYPGAVDIETFEFTVTATAE